MCKNTIATDAVHVFLLFLGIFFYSKSNFLSLLKSDNISPPGCRLLQRYLTHFLMHLRKEKRGLEALEAAR